MLRILFDFEEFRILHSYINRRIRWHIRSSDLSILGIIVKWVYTLALFLCGGVAVTLINGPHVTNVFDVVVIVFGVFGLEVLSYYANQPTPVSLTISIPIALLCDIKPPANIFLDILAKMAKFEDDILYLYKKQIEE